MVLAMIYDRTATTSLCIASDVYYREDDQCLMLVELTLTDRSQMSIDKWYLRPLSG